MKSPKDSVKIRGALAEIQIEHPSNTNLEDYFYINMPIRVTYVPGEIYSKHLPNTSLTASPQIQPIW
jgi:hypothetical protein